ncbi:MAG: hypothetical protein ACRYFA_14880 [Janthinobacterium lividum]
MMKKLITATAIVAITLTAAFAQTKKDSSGTRKYTTTRPPVKYKPTATTNGGKPDLRYKMHKKVN